MLRESGCTDQAFSTQSVTGSPQSLKRDLGETPNIPQKAPWEKWRGLSHAYANAVFPAWNTPEFFPVWFPVQGKKNFSGTPETDPGSDSTSWFLAVCLAITQLPAHFLLFPSLTAPQHLQYLSV